jgi:hypothetical protein
MAFANSGPRALAMRILQMRALEKDNLTFNRAKTFGE